MAPTNAPVVSLVTPTYNRHAMLRDTIDSVLKQTYPNIEYIIVDDGSTDETGKFLSTLPDSIRVIRQLNAGQVAALTAGWDASTGQYLSYISDDDLLFPGTIAALVAHLESNPEALAAFPNADMIDEIGRTVRQRVCRPFSHEALVVEQECYIGPAPVFRRSAYEKIGPWDDRFSLAPDREFWMRLGAVGRIDFVPEVLVQYRVHPASVSVGDAVSLGMEEYLSVAEKFFSSTFCSDALRNKKNTALAHAYMVTARGHLRAGELRRAADAIKAAKRHDPAVVNLRALARLGLASFPLEFKQRLLRISRPWRRLAR